MKKLLSLALAALTVMSALASCTPAHHRLDSAISLASSEAVDRAKWLDERLEDFPTDVIVGVGSNEAYGIDMTDFEDDGYIVRTIGDDTLVFGASDAGLDRAVRKYAKAAEAGTAENLDETYHEGYRIEKLTIAGNDISEYSVYLPADRNASVDFAAEELVRLVNEACGTTLTVKEGTPGGKYFTFSILDDDSINDAGYKYKVENGNVIIEGKDDFGCPNAVYRFLQNECGWEDLCYGDSILAESDHVDVKDGASFVGNPRFNYFLPSWTLESRFKTDRSPFSEEQCGYGFLSGRAYAGRVRHACHGIQNENFIEYDWESTAGGGGCQPCYNDEYVYEEILENVIIYIEAFLNAGKRIGNEFKCIDVSHPDIATFCQCRTCLKVYKEEGMTNAGSVVRFTNALIEELDKDYDGLKYLLFAYQGTQKPCETKPNEDIYITFCTDRCCANHDLNDPECIEGTEWNSSTYTNVKMTQWLEGWCEISSRVYIWHYGLDNGLGSNNHVDTLYEDIKYFDELDVFGVYMEFEYLDYNMGRITNQLGYAINWDREMTEEEYYAELDRLLKKDYGDGWEYVRICTDHWTEGENRRGCFNCWDILSQYCEQDWEYATDHFDEVYEYSKRAITMANSSEQETYCVKFFALMVYQASNCAYFNAYNSEDAKMLALIEERWSEMRSEYIRIGVSPDDVKGIGHYGIASTCEEEAWTEWLPNRHLYTDPAIPNRSTPEKYR